MRPARTNGPGTGMLSARKDEQFWGYTFILPNFLATAVFLLIPLIY